MSLNKSIHNPVDEIIHGVSVQDPYRWLETRELAETEQWIVDQRKRCDCYFANCSELDTLRECIRESLDIEATDQPARIAGKYFYRRRRQGQQQGSIYVRNIATEIERILVDPFTLGPFASVGIHSISPDGLLLAYELKCGGGDQKAIHLVEVESGLLLSDSIPSGYARGFAFRRDGAGFYYCQERSGQVESHSIRCKQIGTSEADETCFEVKHDRGMRLILVSDQVHLGALVTHQCDGEPLVDLWIARREEPRRWSCVLANRTAPFFPFLAQGHIYAICFDGAINGKVIEIDLLGNEIANVVAEQAALIRQVAIVGERIYINYLDQTVHFVHCWDLAGKDLGPIPLPSNGTIQILHQSGVIGDSIFFSFESFHQRPSLFEQKSASEELISWEHVLAESTNLALAVRHETYCSKDGKMIRLTLVVEEGTDSGGPLPIVMTSYGGFGVSMTPTFSIFASMMIKLGCVLALPHVRGGGEAGRSWHEAARGINRQVAFDDFIAAGEWLCERGMTTPALLTIFGGSNSGLLVAAVMIQRPDLFRAVLCIAPLLDMVRYESFDDAARWRHEYGTVTNSEEFAALFSYSPYHRVDEGVNYPAVLFVTGDKDDRCNPAHVRKMAERLLDRSSQRSPVLVDYGEERGHSPVLPLYMRIEALTKRIAFLCNELNIPIARGGHDEKTCD